MKIRKTEHQSRLASAREVRIPRSQALAPIIQKKGTFRNTMRKRVMFGLAVLLLSILASLVVSQGSFSTVAPAPSNIQQTYLFWAVSTLIFILTIALGFMLFRTVVKLYIERQTNRPGSHIKSKLIGGAIAQNSAPAPS